MLDNVVLTAETAQAIKTPTPFTSQNAIAVFLALEEILCLDIRKLRGLSGDHNTWDLGGEIEPNLTAVTVAVEDNDAALLLKRLKLLVGRVLRHRLTLFADTAGHTTPR